MAQSKKVRETAQYNAEMYMARLTLKSPGIHFCTLLICIYTLIRIVLSVVTMMSGGNVLISLISVAGLIMLSVGSVCALFFSRDGGARLITVLTLSLAGAAALLCTAVLEMISLKADAETIFQCVFALSALIVTVSLMSAAKGTSANTAGCYLLGISGFATLIFSAVALISVCSALRGCFASSYNWGFLPEDIDITSGQLKWYFIGSNASNSAVKAVFFSRIVERIAFLITVLAVSAAALKMGPYINSEKRRVGFAQEVGDFSAFDGDDFRTISKKRATENVRNQSYYGVGSLGENSGDYENDIQEEISAPQTRYKTNEYGDYLDEETGIFYYYDDRTGKYYYLDEKSGQYVYKQENRRNAPTQEADAMPWELSDTAEADEDDIYNY